MDLFLRFSLCFSLLVGCVVGIGFGQPQWIATLGLDFWKLPELNHRINKASELGANLDQIINSQLENIQYKTRIVEDLIAEKLPFPEAVVMVKEVTSQEAMDLILGSVEGNETTLNGKAGRLLIYWVGQELKHNPQQRDIVCSRLEKELNEAASLWN